MHPAPRQDPWERITPETMTRDIGSIFTAMHPSPRQAPGERIFPETMTRDSGSIFTAMHPSPRQAPRIRIIPETMTREEVLKEVVHFCELPSVEQQDTLPLLEWLAARKIIRNECNCLTCKIQMTLARAASKVDRYMWRCKVCKRCRSVRDSSFFSGSKLPLDALVRFVYCWARDLPQRNCAFEALLLPQPQCTRTTVEWAKFCRDVCEQWLEEHPCIIGGLDENGEPKMVEIHQSKFFYRKYNRGLWTEGNWVFVGIERYSGKCFLVEVSDQKEDTLVSLIRRYILPGTIIVSDGWVEYANIENIEGGIYEHDVVEFSNGDIALNLGSTWMRAKSKIRSQYGTTQELLPSHLHEYLWRTLNKNEDALSSFIVCLWDYYPLS